MFDNWPLINLNECTLCRTSFSLYQNSSESWQNSPFWKTYYIFPGYLYAGSGIAVFFVPSSTRVKKRANPLSPLRGSNSIATKGHKQYEKKVNLWDLVTLSGKRDCIRKRATYGVRKPCYIFRWKTCYILRWPLHWFGWTMLISLRKVLLSYWNNQSQTISRTTNNLWSRYNELLSEFANNLLSLLYVSVQHYNTAVLIQWFNPVNWGQYSTLLAFNNNLN